MTLKLRPERIVPGNLNVALAELVRVGPKGRLAREGGPTVRLSVGPAEHAVGRYVVDTDEGVVQFDADDADLESVLWTVNGAIVLLPPLRRSVGMQAQLEQIGREKAEAAQRAAQAQRTQLEAQLKAKADAQTKVEGKK